MGMQSRAAENKKIRQEALREQLAAQGHVQHVVDIANKLNETGYTSLDLQRLKLKADIHLKLIDKYLPTVKPVELSGDPDNPVETRSTIVFNPVSRDNN